MTSRIDFLSKEIDNLHEKAWVDFCEDCNDCVLAFNSVLEHGAASGQWFEWSHNSKQSEVMEIAALIRTLCEEREILLK